MNLQKWQELPPAYRAATETACAAAAPGMLVQYGWKNIEALYPLS